MRYGDITMGMLLTTVAIIQIILEITNMVVILYL